MIIELYFRDNQGVGSDALIRHEFDSKLEVTTESGALGHTIYLDYGADAYLVVCDISYRTPNVTNGEEYKFNMLMESLEKKYKIDKYINLI